MNSVSRKTSRGLLLAFTALQTIFASCAKEEGLTADPVRNNKTSIDTPIVTEPTTNNTLKEMADFIRSNADTIATQENVNAVTSKVDSVLINGKKLDGRVSTKVGSNYTYWMHADKIAQDFNENEWRRFYFGGTYSCAGHFNQVHSSASVTMKNNKTGLSRTWENVAAQIDSYKIPGLPAADEAPKKIEIFMTPTF